MNSRAKGSFLIGTLLFFAIIVMGGCGSSYNLNGYYNGAEIRATISNVDVIAGTYLLNPGMITSYATTNAGLNITMSLNTGWGQFMDYIYIWVSDARVVQPGIYYSFGANGLVGAHLTIQGTPHSPSGTIRFTKISNYYDKSVCADFEFLIADGDLVGNFCGDVLVGY